MPRESGASSTLRLLGSNMDVSGILDRPTEACRQATIRPTRWRNRVALTCPRHCERSEAIHSFFARRDGLLRGACHRARIRATRWLAMTVIHHTFAFSRRVSPEAYINLSPNGGRRERRVLAAPAVSRAKMHIASAHEHTGT